MSAPLSFQLRYSKVGRTTKAGQNSRDTFATPASCSRRPVLVWSVVVAVFFSIVAYCGYIGLFIIMIIFIVYSFFLFFWGDLFIWLFLFQSGREQKKKRKFNWWLKSKCNCYFIIFKVTLLLRRINAKVDWILWCQSGTGGQQQNGKRNQSSIIYSIYIYFYSSFFLFFLCFYLFLYLHEEKGAGRQNRPAFVQGPRTLKNILFF